ncbi:hypothetical protein GCM10028796_17550 [Ramlibacter monticola]|uniref:Uncharacterized protein n=1 Tax=Ramlibacter monticola TaxID=1926872 RepID=A0A936YYQ9_9BURK|nr:hypothetical protein [Ramlibacter monticola]MBL0390581.1 hypothetical protein [Ramlibacter monticola]
MFDEQHAQALRDLDAMRAERDEADRRAGAAERELDSLREAAAARTRWLDKAKDAAGYDRNVSFDVVWADTLAAFKWARGDLEPVAGDVLPKIGERVLIHLARPDSWVEHTVVGYYVWPPVTPSGIRVFIRVRHPGGSLNARLLKDVCKLDGTPFLPAPKDGVAIPLTNQPKETK